MIASFVASSSIAAVQIHLGRWRREFVLFADAVALARPTRVRAGADVAALAALLHALAAEGRGVGGDEQRGERNFQHRQPRCAEKTAQL